MIKLYNWKVLGLVISLFLSAQFGKAQTPVLVAGTATKTATQSGNWTSGSTWGGSIPSNNARVLIPNGITVTVNSMVSQEMKSIRIANGGKLKFAPNVNTELRTEYLVSEMMGTLEIGTSANRIATGSTASLVFAERGGTSSSFDPERFAPGAVLMGPTTMFGAQKTSWLALQQNLAAGAIQMTLETTPSGWQVGDQLVIAGTDPITNASATGTNVNEFKRDEVVTITNVTGKIVDFTPALQWGHGAPSQAPNLDVHVANLSRNIIVSSERTEVASISGSYRKPRGHLMFMHNMNVELNHMSTNNLGRTDKKIVLDDYDFGALDRSSNTGSPVANGKKNPRGRYSIHFHRGGLDQSMSSLPYAVPETPLPTPVRVEGCVVNNDPGWAFVNHSSRVDFVRNVSYNVVGGAFNTEAGNETGSFVQNIAIRTVNDTNPIMPAPRPRNSYVAENSTTALADLREERQDFAWQGDGFWLHGTGVTVSGNVVSGCTGHAYVYWVDGLIERGLGMARGDIDAHVPAAEFPAQNAALKSWKQQNPGFVLDIWYLQPRPFTGNTAYGFVRGVQTYYVHTDFHRNTSNSSSLGNPNVYFNDLPATYKDQLNLILDNTTLWNIGRVGFEHNHTTNVTIQNSRIVGYGSRTGHENYGTNPAPSFLSNEPEVIGIDLDFYQNTQEWTLRDNIIEGFSGNAVGLTTTKNAQLTIDGGTFNNSGADIVVTNASEKFFSLTGESIYFGVGMESTDPTQATVNIQGNINFLNPSNNIVMDAQILYNRIGQKGFSMLGFQIKEDPLHFFAPQEITLNFGPFNNSRLYFDEQDAGFTPITSANRCGFGEFSSQCVSNSYRNKTNAQLNSQYGRSFLGEVTPTSAVTHPIIVGGKATNVGAVGGGCNWSTINSNNFESGWGIWNDGGSDARRSSSDAAYSNGTYSIRLRDNTYTSVMTTDNIDLSGVNEVRVSFSYYARSMDNSNEDFWLQVSNNGGSSYTTVEEWNRNDEFVNNQRYNDVVTIPGPFASNSRLRFRCDASGNSDWVYIDDAVIEGCSGGAGPTQYTLTTSTSGSGSVSLNPSGGTYNSGTKVTATAEPIPGWKFDNWSGASTSTSPSVEITMDADKALIANFSEIPLGSWTKVDDASTLINYTGVWSSWPVSIAYQNTIHWTESTGIASFSFSGTQVRLYGIRDPWSGTANISIDGGTPVSVSEYQSSGENGDVLVYESPVLSNGQHTITVDRTAGEFWIDAFEYFGTSSGSRLTLPERTLSESKFNVYPNPTDGELSIQNLGLKLDETISVELLDLSGKVHYRKTRLMPESNLVTIDLSGVEKGLYFISIQSESVKHISKVLVE